MDGLGRDVDVMVVIGTEAGLGWRRAELQCQRAPLLDWCSGRHGTCAARGADRTPCHSTCNTARGGGDWIVSEQGAVVKEARMMPLLEAHILNVRPAVVTMIKTKVRGLP